MEEQELRQLAENARRILPDLVPDKTERVQADRDLDQALSEPVGEAKPALMAALRSHQGIRRWVAGDTLRSIGQLGDLTEPIGVLYVCPREDYTVVIEDLVDEPRCPHDGTVLVRFQR
jgi:hypothetical protein